MTAKKMGTGKKIGVGVGIVTAAALAGAAGYYLYGKNGAKNRKKAKALGVKAYAEVAKEARKLKAVSKTDYHKLVDVVTKKYAAIKSIDKKELRAVAGDLKRHWKNIEAEARVRERALVSRVKKVKKSLKRRK